MDATPARDVEVLRQRLEAVAVDYAKQWRGLATRYDKLAITYRGGVVLAAIVTGYAL